MLSVIEKTIQDGVANDRLTAILHQIELHQREVTGDGMPYGLNLMLRALGAATHFGDAVEALDLDPAVKRLQAKLNEDGYIESRMRSAALDNPHRVRLTVAPDPSLDQTRKEREKERLSDMQSKMDADDLERTRSTAVALEARQRQTDDPEFYPKWVLRIFRVRPTHQACNSEVAPNTRIASAPLAPTAWCISKW